MFVDVQLFNEDELGSIQVPGMDRVESSAFVSTKLHQNVGFHLLWIG